MKCPFNVKVGYSADGQRLIIKSMDGEHNHEIDQVLHKFVHLKPYWLSMLSSKIYMYTGA